MRIGGPSGPNDPGGIGGPGGGNGGGRAERLAKIAQATSLATLSATTDPKGAIKPPTGGIAETPSYGSLLGKASSDVESFQHTRRESREQDVRAGLEHLLGSLSENVTLNWAQTDGTLRGSAALGLLNASLARGDGPAREISAPISPPFQAGNDADLGRLAETALKALGTGVDPVGNVRLLDQDGATLYLAVTSDGLTTGDGGHVEGAFEHRLSVTLSDQGDRLVALQEQSLSGTIDLRASLSR